MLRQFVTDTSMRDGVSLLYINWTSMAPAVGATLWYKLLVQGRLVQTELCNIPTWRWKSSSKRRYLFVAVVALR